MPLSADVALVVLVDGVPQKAGGDQRFGVIGGGLVAGELLADETIVRLVAIEGMDDVIAITPGVRPIFVQAKTVRLGIAGQVEPVPAPAFAVARAGKQTVHQPVVGIGSSVGEKGVNFCRRRGQTDQVEGDPADQRGPIGRGAGCRPSASSRCRMK